MQVKADFHAHSNIDDVDILDYSPEEYISWAVKRGYKVLALTHHDKLFFPKKLVLYAKKKGILLIPGIEATVEGMHVVILNPSTDKITTWGELEAERKKGKCFVILPHPFWSVKNVLSKRLERLACYFDAVEECWLHTPWFSFPNRLARAYAKRHRLPMVSTGDVHKLQWAGTNYSLVDVSKLSVEGVFSALRAGKVKCVQKNVKSGLFIYLIFRYLISGPIYNKHHFIGKIILWRRKNQQKGTKH